MPEQDKQTQNQQGNNPSQQQQSGSNPQSGGNPQAGGMGQSTGTATGQSGPASGEGKESWRPADGNEENVGATPDQNQQQDNQEKSGTERAFGEKSQSAGGKNP